MSEHPISDLVSSAMASIKEMVDVNTIIGKPIETSGGITIIPISRVTFGFGAGGSEFEPKKESVQNGLFGGGSGAGVSITPVGFLTVSGDEVKMVPVCDATGMAVDKIIQSVPPVVDKVTEFFKKRKEKKESEF